MLLKNATTNKLSSKREFTMINEIRPSVIFRHFEMNAMSSDRSLNTLIPSPDIGSTTMLEKALLVALLRINNSKRIFEFGTFRGETTHLFSVNSSPESNIFSIDLPISIDSNKSWSDLERLDLFSGEDNDNFLRQFRIDRLFPEFQHILKVFKDRIKLIELDSKDLCADDFSPVDFIFIDGGHSTELIHNDTNKAFQMLSETGIIVWHDYESAVHTDVTDYLTKFSYENNRNLYHVLGTKLAIYFAPKILENLF
jgi:hypothetical protein